jgi:hypothetical protein
VEQQIESLVDNAPMPVRFDRAGEPRRLPAIVGRGAYRVVRDSLEAAPCATEASVAIEFVPGAFVVQIDHDCRCARDLEELEDLAAALGGGLSSKDGPDGFRVRAWLPTEGQPPSP